MAAGTLITNFDTTKTFLGNGNRYISATYTNGGGSTASLAMGRLMGRIFSSNKVTPQAANATDGSEFPIGVLMENYEVAAGASQTVWLCVAGDVNRDKVTFSGSDAWASTITRTYNHSSSGTTAIPWGTIEDNLRARSHINLVTATDQTGYDNQ